MSILSVFALFFCFCSICCFLFYHCSFETNSCLFLVLSFFRLTLFVKIVSKVEDSEFVCLPSFTVISVLFSSEEFSLWVFYFSDSKSSFCLFCLLRHRGFFGFICITYFFWIYSHFVLELSLSSSAFSWLMYVLSLFWCIYVYVRYIFPPILTRRLIK